MHLMKGEGAMKKTAIPCLLLVLLIGTGCGQRAGYAKDGYGEGGLGDPMHTYFFDYTVKSVRTCDEFEGYVPMQEGYLLLVADVAVKNTHVDRISMYDTDFLVQWNMEGEYDAPITYYTEPVSAEQLPAEYGLAVNEERTGLLVFEVPADQKEFSISYVERFEDGTEEGEEGDPFSVCFTVE